jgi:hypothetical protein
VTAPPVVLPGGVVASGRAFAERPVTAPRARYRDRVDEGLEATGAADAEPPSLPRVTTSHVMTAESLEREVRALRRWHLRRPALWRVWGRSWGMVLAAVLVGSLLLGWWLASDPWALDPALVAVVALVVAGVDALTLGRRSERMFRRLVSSQCPPGTPVQASFDATRFSFTTPDASTAVATDAITRGTWVENCLVVDTRTEKFLVLPGDLLDGEAWAVVTAVLGPRLRIL